MLRSFACNTRCESRKWMRICKIQIKKFQIKLFHFHLTVLWSVQWFTCVGKKDDLFLKWEIRFESNHPQVFFGKVVLKTWRALIPKCYFKNVGLMHIFRTPFLDTTSTWLLLMMWLQPEFYGRLSGR